MDIIKPKDKGYEMTEEQYGEIQSAMYSISDLVEVMNGYCNNKFDDVKEMGPLLTLISQIKGEEKRITNLF